jgi:subtilase family serine protease
MEAFLKIRKTWLAVVAATGVCLAGASAVPAAHAASQAATPLPGSVPAFTANTAVTGSVAGSQKLTIQLWLKPDLSGLQSFAAAASTPGNSQFRHYLSPSAYTARFGPAASQVNAVESWLRGQGFGDISTDSQRTYVRATAPVSAIDAAFRVQEKLYRATATVNAGPYQLRANDSAVTLPSSLANGILAVTGLNNQVPSIPLERPGAASSQARMTADGIVAAGSSSPTGSSAADCSSYYGQLQGSGLPSLFGYTTLPVAVCGYDAAQLRSAYGLTGIGGTGQTIAFAQVGLPRDMFLTLQDYAKANNMPAPSASLYGEESVDGTGASCGDTDPFDGEEQLDVEAAHVMAPGARELVVGGDPCDNGDLGEQGFYDAETAILDGSGGKPLASVVSNSWEDFGTGEVSQLASMTNALLMRAAAEGVGMYFATGDYPGASTPSTDPYATAVGGTTLAIGKTGNRLFETGWSDGAWTLTGNTWESIGVNGASGGGPSTLWTEPDYQRGVVPSTLTIPPGDKSEASRSVPDISADADPFTGFAEGQLTFSTSDPSQPPVYSESDIGGTSLATPLIAGLVADAQQGQAAPFGFINPVLYKLASTSAIRDVLPVTSKTPAQYRGSWCPAAACNGVQGMVEFDDQNPSLSGYLGQVTLKGYDNMTGVGTPNGPAFNTALRRLG